MALKDQVLDLKKGDSVKVESSEGNILSGTVDEIRDKTEHGTFYEAHVETKLPGLKFSVSVEGTEENVYMYKAVKGDGGYEWEGLGEVESIEEI